MALHHVVVVVASLLELTRVAVHLVLMTLTGLDEVEVVDLLDVLNLLVRHRRQLVLLDVQLVLSELLLVLVPELRLLSLTWEVHHHRSLGRLRLLLVPSWVRLRTVVALLLHGRLLILHGLLMVVVLTHGLLGDVLQLLLELLIGHPQLKLELLLLARVHMGRIELLIHHRTVVLHALELT